MSLCASYTMFTADTQLKTIVMFQNNNNANRNNDNYNDKYINDRV